MSNEEVNKIIELAESKLTEENSAIIRNILHRLYGLNDILRDLNEQCINISIQIKKEADSLMQIIKKMEK